MLDVGTPVGVMVMVGFLETFQKVFGTLLIDSWEVFRDVSKYIIIYTYINIYIYIYI